MDLTLDQRHVVDVIDLVLEDDRAEAPVHHRQLRLCALPDQPLGAKPIPDQVRDGEDCEIVCAREPQEIRHPRHRAVIVHDLADDPGRLQAGEPREVDAALRLSGPAQHPALLGHQREDMPRPHEILGPAVPIHCDRDRVRAVRRRDPGRDPLSRLDRNRERSPERGLILRVGHHHRKFEFAGAGLGQPQANQPPPVPGHEVHGLGRHLLGRHAQVALVLAILVIDQDHQPARSNVHEHGLHVRDQILAADRVSSACITGVSGGACHLGRVAPGPGEPAGAPARPRRLDPGPPYLPTR